MAVELKQYLSRELKSFNILCSRSQWPRGLRRRSAAACLLRSWVRIPPGAWMFVCCECCVLSGRGLCHELITRPEESYRLWCVVVCDLETSRITHFCQESTPLWPEGLCKGKISIEPPTFGLIAQCFNQLRHRVPPFNINMNYNCMRNLYVDELTLNPCIKRYKNTFCTPALQC